MHLDRRTRIALRKRLEGGRLPDRLERRLVPGVGAALEVQDRLRRRAVLLDDGDHHRLGPGLGCCGRAPPGGGHLVVGLLLVGGVLEVGREEDLELRRRGGHGGSRGGQRRKDRDGRRENWERTLHGITSPSGRNESPARTLRSSSPYVSSFAGPTPLTPLSPPRSFGLAAASASSVASWKTT